MDEKRKSFTYIWKIKNFSFINSATNMWLNSPTFFARAIYETNWNLLLVTNSVYFHDCVVCRLQREYFGPLEFELDYELSFLTSDKSVIYSEIFLNKAFKKDNLELRSRLTTKKDEIYVQKKHLFLPDDTLIVRCRMWKSQESILEQVFFKLSSAKCSVETRIKTQSTSFIGNIQNFSSLKASSKNAVCVKSSEKIKLSSIYLCVDDDDKLYIDINIVNMLITTYKFKVFILDVHGNKVKSSQEAIFDSPFRIPLTFSREHLIENKEYYIPNDELTLHLDVAYFEQQEGNLKSKLKITGYMLYEYDYQQYNQAVTSNASDTKKSSEEYHTESLPTLTDDFISLFREGILSDIKLKTATETFPAHTVVLTARSPVFKSMFTTDMREKTNNCVDIDDLNADTVRQMLFYMYSDTLDDLGYERAKNLYYAADKYNIILLRHKCSNFLKKNILPSNCCDVLLLADRHQDKDLKKSVQDCIAENDEAVFSSEWKDLEDNHPRLTTETFRAVYMKNRKT